VASDYVLDTERRGTVPQFIAAVSCVGMIIVIRLNCKSGELLVDSLCLSPLQYSARSTDDIYSLTNIQHY
jgi:hypothetical protein